MIDGLYTTPEAADAIGITPEYLRSLLSKKIVTATHSIGGRWLFTEDDVARIRTRPLKKVGRPVKEKVSA